MIFKSFDNFIAESNSARLLPINEYGNKTDRFAVTENTPNYDETKNLSISAVYTSVKKRISEEGVINLAKNFAQLQLPSQGAIAYQLEQMNREKEPSVIIFIKEKTIRQRTVINTNILFDFDLFIKKRSSGFKSDAEIQKMKVLGKVPYMTIRPIGAGSFLKTNEVDIWDIKDIESLKSTKGAKSNITDPNANAKALADANAKALADANAKALADANKNNTNGNPVAGTVVFPAVTGFKKGDTKKEIGELQRMIMAGAIANTTDSKYKTAAEAVRTHGGDDNQYGGQTALAIGTLLDQPNVKITEITSDIADKLKTALSAVTADQIKTITDQSVALKKEKSDGSKIKKPTDGTKQEKGTGGKANTGKYKGKKIKVI